MIHAHICRGDLGSDGDGLAIGHRVNGESRALRARACTRKSEHKVATERLTTSSDRRRRPHQLRILSSSFDEVIADRVADEMGGFGKVELPQRRKPVDLDSSEADVQQLRNSLGRVAFSDQLNDLAFSLG